MYIELLLKTERRILVSLFSFLNKLLSVGNVRMKYKFITSGKGRDVMLNDISFVFILYNSSVEGCNESAYSHPMKRNSYMIKQKIKSIKK